MALPSLLRRQSYYGSSLSFSGTSISDPPIAAAVAFAVLNLLALLGLLVASFFVRPFAIREGRQHTRFARLFSWAFTLVNQAWDLALNVVESTTADITPYYLITYIFYYLFQVSADLALIYTLFGYMYALAVLRGDAQAARGWRTAGIVMIIITSVIMGVWFALYCVRTARLIGPYVSTPGLSSRYLVLAGSGINLAFDAIRLVLACVFLGFGIHALVRYRHSSNFSRIPLLLLVTTWPFYLFTMLAALATDVAWRYHVVSSSVEDSVPIITTITRFSFLVVVYSGLVASGRRPEWSQASGAAGPMQSGWRDPNAAPYNPGFDPTHFTLPQHQNQTGIAHTANQPTYGGGPPSTTTGMSGTTAHGAADSHYKPELPLNAAPYPELPNQYQNQQPQQHAMGGGYDPYYRGPQQRTSELPAGYHPYRGSPPPQSELPGALRAGSPPAPAELNSPRRF